MCVCVCVCGEVKNLDTQYKNASGQKTNYYQIGKPIAIIIIIILHICEIFTPVVADGFPLESE